MVSKLSHDMAFYTLFTHPHHVNETIPVIVTNSLHLVKSKCEVKALFFLDLSVAFDSDDILFLEAFLSLSPRTPHTLWVSLLHH